MCNLTIGIIRVLSTDNPHVLYAHENLIKNNFPDLNFISESIMDQPEGVFDLKSEEIAIPKILDLALSLERRGVDGIIISCCTDPGLSLVKDKLKIPVIGAGMASCLMAKAIGKKIGVTSLLETVPSNLEKLLGDDLLVYQKPLGINNTLDLLEPEGREKVFKMAEDLVNKGADCLILGCTGMATIDIAPEIEERINLPVIDPIIASGNLINYLVKRSRWQNREVRK